MQTQESQESQESQPKQRLMYGDLVNGVTTVVFLPFYIHQAMAHSFALDPDRINNTPCSSIGPWFICCTTAIYAVCCIISWLRVSDNSCQNTASWLAFGGNIATFIGTNQTQWPHPHKELVLVQLMWQLLMVTANKGHLRRTKLLMGLLAVATALFNSATAPMVETVTGASVTGAALGNLPEHGPTILGTAVAYFLFHWGVSPTLGSIHGYSVTSFQSDTRHLGLYNTNNAANSTMTTKTHRDDVWEAVREQCARLCLIGAFCAFIVSEVTSVMTQSGSDVATRGYQVIGIILCAFVGLEAAGYSIRRHQQQQRQLYQCVQTAEHLRFARVALNVSDTAMVFTDMQQHIVWLNPAFLRLIGQDENEPHDLLHQTLSDVLRLAHRDAQRLQHCFCHIDSILGHTGNSNDSVTASNSGGNSNAHSNSSNNTPYTSTVCEEDIMALDKILHVKVLRSSDVDHTNTSNAPSYNVDQQQQQQQPSSSDYSFAVALQDVTEERTMEQFLQAAASTSRQSSQRRSNSAAPLVEAATRMGTTARHWILRKQERTDRGRQ